MKAIKVTLKDGEVIELDPVVNITIDNSYTEFDFNPDDAQSLELIE